jgi:hypothetical protein
MPVATCSFENLGDAVEVGSVYPANHPCVVARPDLFTEDSLPVEPAVDMAPPDPATVGPEPSCIGEQGPETVTLPPGTPIVPAVDQPPVEP